MKHAAEGHACTVKKCQLQRGLARWITTMLPCTAPCTCAADLPIQQPICICLPDMQYPVTWQKRLFLIVCYTAIKPAYARDMRGSCPEHGQRKLGITTLKGIVFSFSFMLRIKQQTQTLEVLLTQHFWDSIDNLAKVHQVALAAYLDCGLVL